MKKMYRVLALSIIYAMLLLFIACSSNEEQKVISEESVEDVSENVDVPEISSEVISVDTVADEVSEESTETLSGEVTDIASNDSPIISMDTILFAQKGVNVRSGPGTEYEKVGTLSTNEEVIVTGQDAESGWYQIDYNGKTAFVSDSYLGENKVTVAATSNNNGSSGNTPPAPEQASQPSISSPGQGSSADNDPAAGDMFTGQDIENALQWNQQMNQGR